MSPRNPRSGQGQDAPPRSPGEGMPVQGDAVAVSIAGSEHRDRLEVHTSAALAASPAPCLVVASRAYARRLCRRLREAQLTAAPLERDALADLPVPDQGIVLVVETRAVDEAPPLAAPGVIAVALSAETSTEAHVAALQAGWDAVADRDAPVTVIVEVVWEAARGRTLLRHDVAQRLAARPKGAATTSSPATPAPPTPAPPTPAPPAAAAEPAARAHPGSAAPPASPQSRPEHVAHVEIERRRRELNDRLGEPRTALARVGATDAWQQMFEHAWVLWRPSSGVCILNRGGAIATRYAQLGGPVGSLGCPVEDEATVGAGSFCRFSLPGSAIVWHPKYGVHETRGPIGEYWLDTLGGARGPWGFPTSGEYDAGEDQRAADFEGGTLILRADGSIGELPRQQEFEVDRWLTVLADPPRRPGASRSAVVAVREPADPESGVRALYYTSATAGSLARVHDPVVVAVSRQIEHARSLVAASRGSKAKAGAGLLRTTVGPEEVLQANGTELPPGVTAEQLHRAELDLWRDIWDGEDLSTAATQTTLSWGGFTADGHLESLLATLFSRSPDARILCLDAGFTVENLDGRLTLIAADTEQGWRLVGDDAERYLRCEPRILALLDAILFGAVAPELLAGDPDSARERNQALQQAALDAQFLTVVAHAGRLPGWSLLAPWTRELRAAVAHNLHLGCLTGWDAFAATGGDPVEVLRTVVKDFFCGPAVLLAQSRDRFEGPAGHGALAEAALHFPPGYEHDDPHARYIVAGGERRRVDT